MRKMGLDVGDKTVGIAVSMNWDIPPGHNDP